MKLRGASTSTPGLLLMVAVVVAVLVTLPYIVRGAPAKAHDFEFHLNTWLELARAFDQTYAYPQWAEGANFGLGEPRFVFYPPLSISVGAILVKVVSLRFAPAAFVLFATMLSAACMWMLARWFVGRNWAFFAAALYVFNPYLLLTIYSRAAYSELLLAAFAPLVILATLRTIEGSWRWTAILAVVYGLAWMTNIPGSILLSYAVALLGVVSALKMRSWKALLRVVTGVALGFGVAASFLAPLAYERQAVHPERVIECSTCVEHNFLFTDKRAKEPVHQQFNHQLSLALSIELAIAAAAIAILASFRRLRERRFFAVTTLIVVVGLLLFSPSLPLWRYLPELKFVQFPWRVAFLLNIVLMLLLAGALQCIRKPIRNALAAVLLLAAVVVPWLWIRRWQPADFDALYRSWQGGYYGVQEYAPRMLEDVHQVPRDLPPIDIGACSDSLRVQQTDRGTRYTCGTATAVVESWNTRRRVFQVETLEPTTFTVVQYWFPTWKVTVNGNSAEIAAPTQDLPFVSFNIPEGTSRVELSDEPPLIKKLARVLSAFSLLIAVILFARDKHSDFAPDRRAEPAVQTVQC